MLQNHILIDSTHDIIHSRLRQHSIIRTGYHAPIINTNTMGVLGNEREVRMDRGSQCFLILFGATSSAIIPSVLRVKHWLSGRPSYVTNRKLEIYSADLVPFYQWLSKVLTIEKLLHDDVIKWKHFPRYWPFVLGIHRSPVNSPHKCQWRRALMFTLICARINVWINNREAGDLRRYYGHYDVIVMILMDFISNWLLIHKHYYEAAGPDGTHIYKTNRRIFSSCAIP